MKKARATRFTLWFEQTQFVVIADVKTIAGDDMGNPPPVNIFSFEVYIPLVLLALLAILMITCVIRFFVSSVNLDEGSITKSYNYCKTLLKYFALLSTVTGVLGALYLARRILVQTAIAGSGWDDAIGPLSNALVFLEFGLLNFTLGLVCMIAIATRSASLIARSHR